MRRILVAVVAGFGLGMFSGCETCNCCSHTQGICDCDTCDDPCYTRAPWSQSGVGVSTEYKQMPVADLPLKR